MSEKLSQKEIDALFAQVNAGNDVEDIKKNVEKKERQYKKYDFNRPEKFSVENLRSISSIMTHFSKSFSQSLVRTLRTVINVEFKSYEQVPFITEYADVINKDEFAFCIINLGHPEIHDILLEFDLAFLKMVHSRGIGGHMDVTKEERAPLTDFEKLTLEKFIKTNVLENLAESFHNVGETNPYFVGYETDPRLLKIAPNNDMIALMVLEIKWQKWTSTLKIVVPFSSIEGVIKKLNSESIREYRGKGQKKYYKEEIEENLKNVVERVRVSLGETELTIDELSKLSVGDYLILDKKVDESLRGFAGGIHKINCYIGREGNKKAMIFDNFIDENDELFSSFKKEKEPEKLNE